MIFICLGVRLPGFKTNDLWHFTAFLFMIVAKEISKPGTVMLSYSICLTSLSMSLFFEGLEEDEELVCFLLWVDLFVASYSRRA